MRRLTLIAFLAGLTLAVPLPEAAPASAVITWGATRPISPRTIVAGDGTLVGSPGAVDARDQRGTDEDPGRYLRLVDEGAGFDVRLK